MTPRLILTDTYQALRRWAESNAGGWVHDLRISVSSTPHASVCCTCSGVDGRGKIFVASDESPEKALASLRRQIELAHL